ncbi:hypothetical protein OSSY52_16460 [Tepiditoga spiralis]|uniref:Uncharacterized protein n=1 Tax=Tepiditoga spiralis TaxID=2108365 RepID=A0A7G1G5U5_9BACT|nr:discoidin domain-containing protein [Tepiditoga spiralis]BBE31505.1 hypothetical protein OSSY52_16460 [Tepiditoga spiralis]
MKNYIRKTVIVVFLLLVSISIFSQQPYSSYWFPETLLNWSPENDADSDFNRGIIPLSERQVGEIVNKNAKGEAKLTVLSIMHPTTSKNPSEGSNKFNIYTFNYWQYVDKLVMWGGSASEGIIVAPSADVINAAHKNGVKVLGTIFFPPKKYGGQLKWYKDFIKKDGVLLFEKFLMADKLIQVADYYGFDGWFINQETDGVSQEDANTMKEFIQYFENHKKPNMEIMWYDAMTENGKIDWQNALNEKNDGFLKVSDSIFLNFWWKDMDSTRSYAKKIGVDPYTIFAGIDTQANGYNTTVHWDGIFPKEETPKVSLGIYCPNWTYSSSKNQEEFYKKASRYWIGENNDPSNTESKSNWKGLANYFPAKTPIVKLPFVTNFNTGNGHSFSVDGKLLSTKDWNNRSLQDILPTWRWIINGNPLKIDFDWTDAYYGGSSLKISGNLKDETTIKLYKTNLKVNKNTQLTIINKANTLGVAEIGIKLKDKTEPIYFVLNENKSSWNKKVISLSNYESKIITEILLKFKTNNEIKNYEFNLGRIAITNNEKNLIETPNNLKITKIDFINGIYANIRLKWKNNQKNLLYQIYREKINGEREYLGSTYNNVFFVSNLNRLSASENKTNLIVIPVNKLYERGKESIVSFDWVAYPKPKADFYVDKTFIAPGDTIQFQNKSKVYDEVKWFFSGGKPLITKEENPKVTYAKEGEYRVTIIAKNAVGKDTLVKEKYITVSKNAKKEMEVVSLTAEATANGNVPTETPKMALDGKKKTKWCAIGKEPHELYVTLEKEQKIGKFIVKHAEFGGESPDYNTKDFYISISKDGKTWKKVVDIKGNKDAITEHLIEPTRTKYIKLTVTKATQGGDTAARIYEFQVLAEKNAFENYALNKKAIASGNVPAEYPALCFDDKVKNNSKWCAIGKEPHWIMVDLGQIEIIDKFIIKHAEEGGENPEWNTKDFYIEVSNDKKTWKKIIDIKGNKKGVTEYLIKPIKARYAKLTVTKATQGGDTAARIYEFQVLGYKTHKLNKAAGKEAIASGCVSTETPNLAVDRDNKTKWCAVGKEPHWILIDLKDIIAINKFIIKHAQAGGESAEYNTKDFYIEVSNDKKTWKKVVDIKGNKKGITENIIKPVEARYVKLTVTKATQGGDTATRIYELEVQGKVVKKYVEEPKILFKASGSNPGETPDLIMDNEIRTKWCAVGKEPHWILIEFKKPRTIKEFTIKHAQAGGEDAKYNTKDYYIEVSIDGKTWKKVVDVKNNTKAITKDAIKPVEAKYVKLTVTKATQGEDTAVRIYELEIN